MNRESEDIAERVARLIRTKEELKTAQLTSQDSGMQFKEATPVRGSVDIVNSQGYGETWSVTNTFTPDHKRPAICIPHMEILTPPGLTWEWQYNYSLNLEMGSVFDSGGNYVASVDVWHFAHRRGTTDGSYAWQSIFYTWGTVYAEMQITISLRSTDTGTHTIQIEETENE